MNEVRLQLNVFLMFEGANPVLFKWAVHNCLPAFDALNSDEGLVACWMQVNVFSGKAGRVAHFIIG